MKKTILFATIVFTLSTLIGCKKEDTTSSTNCSWTNSYLANKTFKVTGATGGSGSSTDSLQGIIEWKFTSDSVFFTQTTANPITITKGTFLAGIENGAMTIRMNGNVLPLLITDFSCNGFKYKQTNQTEPYTYTVVKQ